MLARSVVPLHGKECLERSLVWRPPYALCKLHVHIWVPMTLMIQIKSLGDLRQFKVSDGEG